MIEQVLPDVYRIEIPLPNNPLKATNAYFIRGDKRNLLVDNGFNCDESRYAINEAIKQLNIRMETTDLFITHLHSDHAGLTKYLATPETTVWMSQHDSEIVAASRASSHWIIFNEFVHLSGLAADGLEEDFKKHPGYKYASEVFTDFVIVQEGDVIEVGDYSFQCIWTPGHTPGHMCLYDPAQKILLSGDHILGKITPNITLWKPEEDVLGQYLESLDKIAGLNIDTVLPGHRYMLTDCQGRIEELRTHHLRRLENIMDIIGDKTMHAAQVASQMRWDLSYKDWQDFPWGQKLFATGEAMSHLYHLHTTGELDFSSFENIVYFNR